MTNIFSYSRERQEVTKITKFKENVSEKRYSNELDLPPSTKLLNYYGMTRQKPSFL